MRKWGGYPAPTEGSHLNTAALVPARSFEVDAAHDGPRTLLKNPRRSFPAAARNLRLLKLKGKQIPHACKAFGMTIRSFFNKRLESLKTRG